MLCANFENRGKHATHLKCYPLCTSLMVVNATRALSAHGVLTPKMKVFYFNLQATGSSY